MESKNTLCDGVFTSAFLSINKICTSSTHLLGIKRNYLSSTRWYCSLLRRYYL